MPQAASGIVLNDVAARLAGRTVLSGLTLQLT